MSAGGLATRREVFVGREPELAAIARCAHESAAGQPWLVFAEGEPGIGKTALVRHALTTGTAGLRVCWASGDPGEQDWPYSVLDQWLRRLPPGLPGGQALADLVRRDAPPLAVGSELMGVLAEAAPIAPLALVVDDVQWADERSLTVLEFVLRRLWAEPVLVAAMARTGTSSGGNPGLAAQDRPRLGRSVARVRTLRLTGLGAAEITELVKTQAGVHLGSTGAGRLLEHTGGHPLHLRTLLGQVNREDLQDIAHPLPVPASLESMIRYQLATLPEPARQLVDALAVLDTESPLALAAQLAGVADAAGALGPGLEAGLVAWQPDQATTPVRLHHALQRDAIYQALTPHNRQELHAVAAELVPPDAAWAHRVAASTDTNGSLANELAHEADHQAKAGRAGRAARLLRWAADLAPTRGDHEHYLLAAATHLLLGLQDRDAQKLRDALEKCSPSPLRDAVLGRLGTLAGGNLGAAEELLASAAARAVDPTTRLLARTWLGLVRTSLARGREAVDVLRPVLAQTPPGPTAHHVRCLLATATGQASGPRAALQVIDEGLLPQGPDPATDVDLPLITFRGCFRIQAGQLAEGIGDLTAVSARQRTDSSIPVNPAGQWHLAFGYYLVGRWEDALISADQSLLTAETDGQFWSVAISHAVTAIIHAHQGHRQQALEHLASCRRHAEIMPIDSFWLVMAKVALAHAQSNLDGMLQAMHAMHDRARIPADVRTQYGALLQPLLVEALTNPQRPLPDRKNEAAEALSDFNRLTHPDSGTAARALACTDEWLHARFAQSNGDITTAHTHFRKAVDAPVAKEDDIPLHRGFAHRDYAHLLRASSRASDRHDAATHLTQAYELFRRLGATPHAERAADDLARLGALTPHTHAAVPKGSNRPGELTEREQAVAHLAAQGLTNREIARELFVSPKTIEYHLGHVYTKLNVTNRRQLRRAAV